jgi:hypothetical protein
MEGLRGLLAGLSKNRHKKTLAGGKGFENAKIKIQVSYQ